MSRRTLLAGGAAFAAAATFSTPGLPQAAKAHRIDVHHHVAPPALETALESMNIQTPGIAANWTVQKSLDDMDAAGVATAITSPISVQTPPMAKDVAARLARESNEWAKKLELQHPGRFGTFAQLPLPFIDETLKEIAYAFDTLKVDGVRCMTSYGDKWLGYAEFEPIWQELNRRKATVYTHPQAADCCVNLVRGVDDVYIEFGTDTTRAIFSLIFSGMSQKYTDINWIWSHGGGAVTAFAERFLVQAVSRPPFKDRFSRETVAAELNRYYFDTAQVANDVTLSAMAKLMPISQILYGTDFPYRTSADHTRGVTAFFKGDDLAKVDRENALRLLPRFKG